MRPLTLPLSNTLPESHRSQYPASILAEDLANAKLMAQAFFPRYVGLIGKTINQVYRVKPLAACQLTMGVLSLSSRGKLKATDKAFYRSGEFQVYECDNYRFHTYTYGQGPAVLLLHGWCSKGARWKTYVQRLVEAGYQAVVMDAPSHGSSPGRFLTVPGYIACVGKVLQSRNQWHGLVSHSMGSLAGVIAASEVAREQVAGARFVLMSTFSTCDSLMSKFSRCLGISEQVLADTRAWITHYTGRPLSYFTLSDHMKALGNPPFLLIADEEDIVVPSRETQYILDTVPGANAVITKGLGHNLRCDNVMDKVVRYVVE